MAPAAAATNADGPLVLWIIVNGVSRAESSDFRLRDGKPFRQPKTLAWRADQVVAHVWFLFADVEYSGTSPTCGTLKLPQHTW